MILSHIEQLESQYGSSYLTRVTELSLFFKEIVEINNLNKLINLRRLTFTNTQLSKLENLNSLTNLEYLFLDYNKIKKIENLNLLVNLKNLDLNHNIIEKIENLDNLVNLNKLNLQNNQIHKMENLDTLVNLRFLSLENNKIKKIENLDNLLNLNELNLSHLNIEKIENLDNLLNLQKLTIWRNLIKKIENLDKLTNLCILNLGDNLIEKIENLYQLNNLHTLYLLCNQISTIPIEIAENRRLNSFYYFPNPIEIISPEVKRVLERMNKIKNKMTYSDKQNIHNSHIQKSFRKSLQNLLNDKQEKDLNFCINYLLESTVSEEIKREILNYCEDSTEHSVYLVTFQDIFHCVMNRIIKNINASEMMKILEQEMLDTICKCFTGRITRLINVLNGYYEDIEIQITSNEQISNIIVCLSEKYYGEELKNNVKKELEERKYNKETIEEWLQYL